MIGNSIAGFLGEGVAVSASSFESIATVTGTGSSGTITFSSIAADWKHLQIRCFIKDTYSISSAATDGLIRFNSDTASNYSQHVSKGDGSTASAAGGANNTSIGLNIAFVYGTGGQYGVSIVDILDYSSTDKYKTTKSINGGDLNGSGFIALGSGNWRSLSAINSITIFGANAAWTTQSTFALYGIKGA